jgi:hypothetical protein
MGAARLDWANQTKEIAVPRTLLTAMIVALLTACGGRDADDAANDSLLGNGGFELSAESVQPWVLYVHADPEAFQLDIAAEHARSGKLGAALTQVRDEPWGGLFQHLPPDEWLGARLRLSAWVRPADLTDNVTLMARMHKRSGGFDVAEQRLEAAAAGQGWQRLVLEFEVPADASDLEVAVVLNGGGQVAIDDARLSLLQ